MAQVKFSIITINYNNKEGLRKTIESVINQSFTDFEYLVIDGGSDDGSVEVIKEYVARIDYWVSEPDKGIYNAMNKGILQAHGEYLNFMNSGDCFHDTDVLEWVAAQQLKQDVCIGRVYCLETNIIKELPGIDLSMMDLFRNHPPHQAAFIKKVLFDKQLYDESFMLVADWSFFLDRLIIKNCSYKKLEYIIADYDMNGMSTIQVDLLKKEEVQVLKNMFPDRILKDYEKYKYVDSPLLDLIPELNETDGFHRMICKLIRFLLYCYKKFIRY